jgi:DNA-binding SARP family transcriptional activator
MIMMLSSLYCWIQGRNEECQKLVSEALRLADESGVHIMDHQTLGSAITSALSVGDIERAQELLQRMEGDIAAMGKAFYYYLASWHAASRHDLAAALEFATTGLEFAERIEAPFHMAVNALGAAEIHHELKNHVASVRLYKRAWHIAREMNSPALLFMCNLVAAQFALDRRKDAKGIGALHKAMAIGRQQGYLNMYWWRPDVMARLCAKALERGIEVGYVRDLIRKRNLNPPFAKGGPGGIWMDSWPWPLRIFALGQFRIERDGKPLRSPGKVQKKPLEMLKALIAFGGRDVPGEQIATALWPDADGDAAYKAFGITLIRLRELLGVKDAVHLSEGNVTLDQRYFWIDTWAFEHMLESSGFGVQSSELNAKRQSAIGNRKSEMDLSMLEKAIKLYKGPFLGAESATWSISLRERLRDKFLRSVETVGLHWEERTEWDKAIGCYKKGLEADDLIEELYRRIIICHQRLGRNAEALSAYNRCKKTLTSYGIELSSETRALLKKD